MLRFINKSVCQFRKKVDALISIAVSLPTLDITLVCFDEKLICSNFHLFTKKWQRIFSLENSICSLARSRGLRLRQRQRGRHRHLDRLHLRAPGELIHRVQQLLRRAGDRVA